MTQITILYTAGQKYSTDGVLLPSGDVRIWIYLIFLIEILLVLLLGNDFFLNIKMIVFFWENEQKCKSDMKSNQPLNKKTKLIDIWIILIFCEIHGNSCKYVLKNVKIQTF